MKKKSHLSKPPKRGRHKPGSNGFSSRPDSGQDSHSRDSLLDDDDGEPISSASSFDSLSQESKKGRSRRMLNSSHSFPYSLNLNDSLPLTDQVKRFHPEVYESYESMHWQHPQVYDYINIHPECCVEEEDLTLIKKELDMDHIGKSIDWDEDKSCSWYTPSKEKNVESNQSVNAQDEPSFQVKDEPSFQVEDEPSFQEESHTTNGTHSSLKVLPSGEVVSTHDHSSNILSSDNYFSNLPPHLSEHGYPKPAKRPKAHRFDSYKDLIENKPNKKADSFRETADAKINSDILAGHECEKCGTLIKGANKIKDHLDRHKQLEILRKHAGHLPSREQLVKEVPVLVNRALKGIMDDPVISSLERRVEAYARRLYYNSFPLWKEMSRELVHEVWQNVTLTELTLLPTVDWNFFLWSRNLWLTSGGQREAFVLNLIFLYPDDSEVVEVFFYKFFVKLNDAVYKFAMRCLGSPDTVSDSNRFEPDIRSNEGVEELHTLCGLVLKTYVKRASQNKSVKGWNAIYKCMKRNFVENTETGKPPKSAEMLQWALGQTNNIVTAKSAFRFFSLIDTVIENISKANPKCGGPVTLHKMVLRSVYLRQDIIRAWDKLVASSHFEEMDSLYVLEMLVKSYAFFSGCASARKLKKNGSQ